MGRLHSPEELVKALARVNGTAAKLIRNRIQNFSPKVIVNQCRTRAERDLSLELCAALKKKWRINPTPLGAIDYDDAVAKSVGARKPLMIGFPGASVSADIERLARRILSQEKE